MKAILLLTGILNISNLLGQTDTAEVAIEYHTSHKIDTITGFTITYPLMVFHGKKYDLSISRNKLQNDSIEKKTSPTIIKTGSGYIYNSNQAKRRQITSFETLVTVRSLNTGCVTEFINIGPNQYKIPDSSASVIWTLTTEQKKIANYLCHKATTFFKGRFWEAWYTTEIPLSCGPWKLAGLPGLIIMASDSSQNITFNFNSILFSNSSVTMPNDHSQVITKKRYKTMLTAYAEDPIGFLALQNGLTINTDEIFDKSKLRNQGKLIVPNNPIERWKN